MNLHLLPRLNDRKPIAYVEHCKIKRVDNGIACYFKDGPEANVPVAQFLSILCGPGTSITHDAVNVCSESGCGLVWCGEEGLVFYASSRCVTHTSNVVYSQIVAYADRVKREKVARKMFKMRFGSIPEKSSISQLRGLEGNRIREAYEREAIANGISWDGRRYSLGKDNVNRNLNVLNSFLYAVCNTIVCGLGYVPQLGFIHCTSTRDLVLDVADLYKVDLTIPLAFKLHRSCDVKTARIAFREKAYEIRLVDMIISDLKELFP